MGFYWDPPSLVHLSFHAICGARTRHPSTTFVNWQELVKVSMPLEEAQPPEYLLRPALIFLWWSPKFLVARQVRKKLGTHSTWSTSRCASASVNLNLQREGRDKAVVLQAGDMPGMS